MSLSPFRSILPWGRSRIDEASDHECELAASTSRLRSRESPGQSAHRARGPGNAIAHKRRSTESPE